MSCGKSSHPFSVESLLGIGKNDIQDSQENQHKDEKESSEPIRESFDSEVNQTSLDCYDEDKNEKLHDYPGMDDVSRKRRQRVLFNESQIHILKSVFARQKYLSPEGRKSLADSLNLSPKQVKTWFQNYRYKCRRKIYNQVRCYEEKGQRMTNTNAFEGPFRSTPTNIQFAQNDGILRWDNKINGIPSPITDIPYYFPYPSNLRLLQK